MINEEQSKPGQASAPTIWDRRQHIYLDALPFQPGRLDVAQLVSDSAGVFADFLASGALELPLPAGFHSEGAIQHWYQESRNQERLLGHRPLGLGFPMAFFTDEGVFRAAPLLIWTLQMEVPVSPTGPWRLRRSAGQRVICNPWLLAHFAPRLSDELLLVLRSWELSPPDAPAVEAGIAEMCRQLDWPAPADPILLLPCPSTDALDQLAGEGGVRWSAVLALFPPPDPVDRMAPLEDLLPQDVAAPEGHAFGQMALNPGQATAFAAIRRQRLTLVEGRPGTGKTHLLVHQLTNALSNGRKCLVMAPTLSHLREVYDHLTRLGMGPLSFLPTDPGRDAALLLEFLRAAAEAPPVTDPHDEENFQRALAKWERHRQALDESYRALRKPVFDARNWTESVGLFLASHRKEGKELLAGQLASQDFRFKNEEYRELRDAVLKSRPLYQRVNTLRHPLQELHPDIFLKRNREEGKAFVVEQLEVLIKKCHHLHKSFLNKINEYTDQLSSYYDQWYQGLAADAKRLTEKIVEGRERYGRDFELTSLTSLRLYGAILPRLRAMLQLKEEIFADYRRLAASFSERHYFDFTFPTYAEGRQLPRLRATVADFQSRLDQWRDQLPALVQEDVSRLNEKTVHPGLNYRGHIEELEESLELHLDEVNRTALFKDAFENRMLTIPKRRRYLEEILEQMENTRLFLRDFDAFYDWRRHWLQISEPARKVVRALIKVKPGDWPAAFDSWYINQCLILAQEPALPNRVVNLRQYVYSKEQLDPLVQDQIAHHWRDRRQGTVREFRRHDRKRYQQLFGRKRNDALAPGELWALFRQEWRHVSDILPVWLLTPEMAARLDLPEGAFDEVLVEEAPAISLAQGAIGLRLAERATLFGTGAFAPLGPARSLWEEASRYVEAPQTLELLHRWTPGHPGQLVVPHHLASGAVDGFSVRLDAVDGHYDERRRINEEEARHIIRLLNEVEKTPQRTFPSIAIVALTEEQRDLIAGYIQEIKQRQLPGEEIIQQLERNGLGVFCVDELAGQHPEVILLSVTFANSTLDGHLSAHVQQLNLPEGVARLELLMSRARKSVFAVHSLSAIDLEEFGRQADKPGTFILANYLQYIKALREADADRQQSLIHRLASRAGATGRGGSSSLFIREVAMALEAFIEAPRIHPEALDTHLFLPLKIDPAREQATPLVLLPDGFFSTLPATDYHWEFNQWEYYSNQGYSVYPIWSVNWWKNPQQEARQVAGAIIRHNAGEPSPEE